MNCRVYQQFGGKRELVIEGEDLSGPMNRFTHTDDAQLDIPGISESMRVSVSGSLWNLS
jgi:hypothetical protein